MSNRMLVFLTSIVVILMIVLLLLNLRATMTKQAAPPAGQEPLKSGFVRGIAIEHDEKLYTLNFAQQNDMIHYLNQARRMESISKKPLPFSKIVVYRFNAPELLVTPIAWAGNQLAFLIPDRNPLEYFIDTSDGKLQKLLLNSYDP